MEQIHLLYSYDEYKNKMEIGQLTENTAKKIILLLKSDRTKEEDDELEELTKRSSIDSLLEEYTRSTHRLTDRYIELKDIHDDEKRNEMYNEIGHMQCEIELLKEKWNILNQ